MQTSLLHLGSQTGPVICWLAQLACYLPHGHTGISSNKLLACLIMSRDPLLVAPRLKHQRTAMSPLMTSQTTSVLTIICMQNEEMIIKLFFFLMTCRRHQLYQNTTRFLNILGILYMGSCLSLTTVLSVTCSASIIIVQLRDLKFQKFTKRSQGDAMMCL